MAQIQAVGLMRNMTAKLAAAPAKEMLQCKIVRVCYLHDWAHPDQEIHDEYRMIQEQFPEGISPVSIEDPRHDWAQGKSSS